MNDQDYLEPIPGERKKTKRVIDEVYSSESEEEEDAFEEQKDQLQDKKSDNDSDMFASDDEEKPEEKQPEPKKKKDRRMDMKSFEKEAEIDKEIDNNHFSEVSDDDQPKLEAFDLRQEQEEGYFDEDGNFVRNNDLDDENADSWMKNFNKEDIENAKKAQLRQQAKQQQVSQPIEVILRQLIDHLGPDECCMELLQKLTPKTKAKKKDPQRKKLVMLITECCDGLSNKGIVDVYELSKEELLRLYSRETGEEYRGKKRRRSEGEEPNEQEQNEQEQKLWQFRWLDLDEINGPYSNYEMSYWKDNYFENNVEVRKIGTSSFTHISKVEFY